MQTLIIDSGLRRIVRLVALLNLAYFGIEFSVALAIGSVSLFADSVDFLEHASVNFLIFAALGWLCPRSRATSAPPGRYRRTLRMQTAVSILELVDLNGRSAYFVPMRARWSRSSCDAVARFFGSGQLVTEVDF